MAAGADMAELPRNADNSPDGLLLNGEVIPPSHLPETVGRIGPLPVPVALPALTPSRKPVLTRAVIVLALLLGVGGGGYYYWRTHQDLLPPGIATSNGRLEAEEIDISTKFAGRLAELLVNEGDPVDAGMVVARMDVRDLEASLRKAIAQERGATQALAESRAAQEQQRTQVSLAQSEFDRTSALLQRGFATHELFDQRRQQVDAANAASSATAARVGQAEQVLAGARNDIEYLNINIADNTLVAPRMGRIQYRIANVGEVLSAGGKVFTMLDISDVYMDVFLPTAEAGRVRFGTPARIVLDAYPEISIPAHVSFIAAQAQFTPKAVETKTERDKLMFRVKLRVEPEILKAHAADVRSGLPGLGYVKFDSEIAWPERLRGSPAQ